MKAKSGNKILPIALAVLLGLSSMALEMPSAHAAKAVGTVGTVSDGVDLNALKASDTGIYYGTYDHARSLNGIGGAWGPSNLEGVIKPILWHVMGEEQSDGGITLLSEYVLDSRPFQNVMDPGCNYYNTSDIRAWLNSGTGFLSSFKAAELGRIAVTDVVTGVYHDTNGAPITGSYTVDGFTYGSSLPWTASGDRVCCHGRLCI